MNRYDMIGYLIAAFVSLLGVAALLAAPAAFRREYAKDPHGFASGFAKEITVRPRLGRAALAMVLLALAWDHAAGPSKPAAAR